MALIPPLHSNSYGELLEEIKSGTRKGSGGEGESSKSTKKQKGKAQQKPGAPSFIPRLPSRLPSEEPQESSGRRYKSGKSVISDEDIDEMLESVNKAPEYLKEALQLILNNPYYKDLEYLFNMIMILSLFKSEVIVEIKRKTYDQDIIRSRFEDIMYLGADDPLSYLTYDKYARRRLTVIKKLPTTDIRIVPSYLHNLFDFSGSMSYEITYYVKGKSRTINIRDFNKFMAAHNYIIAKKLKIGYTCTFYAEDILLKVRSPPDAKLDEAILSNILLFDKGGGTDVSRPLYTLLKEIKHIIDPKNKYFHIISNITDSEYYISKNVIDLYSKMKNCVLIDIFFISDKSDDKVTCKIAKFEDGAEIIRISLPACANTIVESKIFEYINKACINSMANREVFMMLFKKYVMRSSKINLIEGEAAI